MPDPCDESVIDFDANTFANIYHVNPKQCIECVENIKEDFFKMVFPQLFVEQLKKFGIFDNTDMEYYETESHSIGADINNPADRDKCYDCLNEILFKRILMKIESSPNLVNNLIDSFMFDGFYKKIGENLKNSCSKVSTSSALDSAPIKTEDRFVNHVLFNKDRLINVPEEIRYYVDRSALSKQILTHLKSMSDNGSVRLFCIECVVCVIKIFFIFCFSTNILVDTSWHGWQWQDYIGSQFCTPDRQL